MESVGKKDKIKLWIIWFALVQSVVIYLVIIHLLPLGENPDDPECCQLKPIFLGLAFVQLIAGLAIHLFVTKRANQIGRATITFIISLALVEAIAIYGLILAFLGTPLKETYLFFGIGLGGLLFLAPLFLNKPSTKNPYVR